MEIITDNYNESPINTFTATCEHCRSVLRLDGTDLHSGEWGLLYFNCPLCGKRSYIDGAEENLTCDTLVYPDNWDLSNMTIQGKRTATDEELLEESEPDINEAVKVLYDKLKNIELTDDEDEILVRYFTGRTMLIMSKSFSDGYIYTDSNNRYEYDLQIVKPLAMTMIYDKYNKTIPNNN